MAITDLTNTTWVINATPTAPSGNIIVDITFTSNSQTYSRFWAFSEDELGYEGAIGYRVGDEGAPTIVYDGTNWSAEAYRTVAISGGTDATNSTLISWFETNAVQQTVTTPDISITYEDTEIATMSESGTKTLKTSGKYCTDDITIEYTKQGGSTIEPATATATLTVAGWSSNVQTVTVNGITSSNTVIVSSAPSSIGDYSSCGVYCSAQGTDSLTFTCSTVPSNAITVNVLYYS